MPQKLQNEEKPKKAQVDQGVSKNSWKRTVKGNFRYNRVVPHGHLTPPNS